MLKFYFDTHIAKAVATQLRDKGLDVIRCEDVGMASATDEEHLIYATEQARIMVSQDDDFTKLHYQWVADAREHAGIMYIPHRYQGESQISHLVKSLLFYEEAAQVGAVDYEIEIKNQLSYI